MGPRREEALAPGGGGEQRPRKGLLGSCPAQRAAGRALSKEAGHTGRRAHQAARQAVPQGAGGFHSQCPELCRCLTPVPLTRQTVCAVEARAWEGGEWEEQSGTPFLSEINMYVFLKKNTLTEGRGHQGAQHGRRSQGTAVGTAAGAGAAGPEAGPSGHWASHSRPGDRAAYLCELRRVVEGHGCPGGRLCRGVVTGSLRTRERSSTDGVTATSTDTTPGEPQSSMQSSRPGDQARAALVR